MEWDGSLNHMTCLQIGNNREMDVVLEEFMVDKVKDIVSNLNEPRSILNFAKDNLQTAETELQDYKHCHERPEFDFMIVDSLFSQRSHLFGELAEAHRKRLFYSTMVKVVSYHQELKEHDYILYRLQSRWRRSKKC